MSQFKQINDFYESYQFWRDILKIDIREFEMPQRRKIIRKNVNRIQTNFKQKRSKKDLKKKNDHSLAQLTKKFVTLIKNTKEQTYDLNSMAHMLKVEKRRVYDITNVLEGINYVTKNKKNTVKWIGPAEDQLVTEKIKESLQQLKSCEQKNKKINEELEHYQNLLKREYINHPELQKMTPEDIEKLCAKMSEEKNCEEIVLIRNEEQGSFVEKKNRNGIRLTAHKSVCFNWKKNYGFSFQQQQ